MCLTTNSLIFEFILNLWSLFLIFYSWSLTGPSSDLTSGCWPLTNVFDFTSDQTFDLWLLISNFWSNLLISSSEITFDRQPWPLISYPNLWPHTSDFWPLTSDIWTLISDSWPQTLDPTFDVNSGSSSCLIFKLASGPNLNRTFDATLTGLLIQVLSLLLTRL